MNLFQVRPKLKQTEIIIQNMAARFMLKNIIFKPSALCIIYPL